MLTTSPPGAYMIFPALLRRCLSFSISAATIFVLMSGISVAEEISGAVPENPADVAAAGVSHATLTQPAQPDRITGEYLKGYVTDTGNMLAAPANWNRCDWLKAGLVIGATSGLYLADTSIKHFAQRNQSSIGDKGAAVGNAVGNPLYTVPALGLLYVYGHFNDDPKARRTSLLTAESLVISGAFTWGIKMTAQRPRPNSGASSTTWDGPGFKVADYSFPSAHTTAAFSIASVLAEEYGDNRYVPPVAYGLATLTGLARIYNNKHWASDVFFGGVVGYVVGKTVVRYHTEQGGTSLKVLPATSRHGFGLMAEYLF